VKVIVLTFGDDHVASTQYRFVQFTEGLRNEGIYITMHLASGFRDWKLAAASDLVVVQKRLMRATWVKKLRRHARLLAFDTDDAIWESHGKPHSWCTRLRTRHRLKTICGAADLCTVANENLAAHLRPLSRQVEIVPMALDEKYWFPAASRKPGPLRIGWAGAPTNLVNLINLSKILADIQRQRPGTEVLVYCGQRPDPGNNVRFTHLPFVPGTEADTVRDFDIGLLPLPDNAFAAGKSPIKALQYAACGIPCIASPVGATCETVRHGETGLIASNPDEWSRAILSLLDDETLRHKLGETARREFIARHTRATVQQRLLDCWQSMVAGRQ